MSINSEEPGVLIERKLGKSPFPNFAKRLFCNWTRQKKKSNSFVGATLNLSNATIGVGILFLPFVISKCGLVFGPLFIFIGAFLGAISLYYLHLSYKKILPIDSTITTYEQVGDVCFGGKFSAFVSCCILLINYGASLTYMIVVEDIISGWVENRFLNIVIVIAVIVPVILVSLSPKVGKLQLLSLLSVGSILVFIIMVIICYFFIHEPKNDIVFIPDFSDIDVVINFISSLGVVVFAFSCHTSFFVIGSEFRAEERHKLGLSIFFSVFLDFVLFSLVGVFGYLTFTSETKGDFIKNYTDHGWIDHVVRVLLCISILSTIPMAIFPAKVTMMTFERSLYLCVRRKSELEKGSKEEKIFELVSNLVTTLGIGGSALIVAIAWPHAEILFSLVGSSASAWCSFILPGLFFIRLVGTKFGDYRKLLPLFLVIFGAIFGLIVTGFSLYKLAFDVED